MSVPAAQPETPIFTARTHEAIKGWANLANPSPWAAQLNGNVGVNYLSSVAGSQCYTSANLGV